MIYAKPIGKRTIFLFLAFTLIHFFGWAQDAESLYRMKTVVIDAGHGGKDPGNLGTGRYKTREKDIALDVALRVGGYIEKQFPEIKVIYTRSTDVFIGLDGRAQVANDAKADLFISIHCNAFTNPASKGVETFALGLHKNKENLDVAMKENSAIFLEDDYKTRYEGFDPNSAESIIALTIMQSAYLQQSLSISAYIQKQFKERVGRRDRGVKQAGFLVLRKTTMPSILIELGFLTNAEEEDFLNSENGKAYMSSAIFRGFKEYKELVEDPLPEGYVPTPIGGTTVKTSSKTEEEKKQALAAEEAKRKAVADSLEQAKQLLIEEKKKREAELAQKAKDDEKARLKARLDSLENVRLAKIAAFKEQEKELAQKRAKELAEKKAKEEAEKKAAEEKAKKELKAKENAKQWLEEIKEVKEKELEDAKRHAATDAEKERLLAIKKQKEQELAEAKKKNNQNREKEQDDSLAAQNLIREQAQIDSVVKERTTKEKEMADVAAKKQAIADSLSTVLLKHRTQQEQLAKQKEKEAEKTRLENQRQDSVKMLRIKQMQAEKEASLAEARRLAKQKAKQDSIAAARKVEADSIALTIDNKRAATPEEAELLFLQLRKKQLEQRIAKLKGKNVEEVTKEKLEERLVNNLAPINKVESKFSPGLSLKVQVVTSSKPLSKGNPQLKGQQVWEYQQSGLYKYTVGDTQDFEEITKLQGELRNLGFKGAFVVAFKDGERIKVSEARELLK